MFTRSLASFAIATAVLLVPARSVTAECGPDWYASFQGAAALDGPVNALVEFDDGTGPALYAGGEFTSADGVSLNGIARWDGDAWSPLGAGTDGAVYGLEVFDDGTGPALYVGGEFTTAGGLTANNIAQWDGATWSALGTGTDGWIRPMQVYDDGTGPALYVGGWFNEVDGAPVGNVARWDGNAWSALDTGVSGGVLALDVFDDGSGSKLWVGGWFDAVNGEHMGRLIAWDGAEWLATGFVAGTVRAIEVWDDGNGPALYIAGYVAWIDDLDIYGVARWDGVAWSQVGGEIDGHTFHQVGALGVYDDRSGGGPALYVGGSFWTVDGLWVDRIARWDGTAWEGLGTGIGATDWWEGVHALCVYDDGETGEALYVGGDFVDTESGDEWLARWGGCAEPKPVKPALVPRP